MSKIRDFVLGKKVERNIVTDCKIDFKNGNIFNIFNIFNSGGNSAFSCNFNKGEKYLGHLDLHLTLGKNGLQTKIETSKGLVGALARESDIIGEALNL